MKDILKNNESETSADVQMSGLKRFLFHFAALVLIPIVLLAMIEIALRLTGTGYQTDFLVKTKIQNQSFWKDNPDFGLRFFPEHIKRSSNRLVVPCEKQAKEFRVVVLGASAAQGDPDPSFGFSRILDVMLSDALPDKKVRVINAAVTAVNSHVVLQISREIKKLQPDIVIVYLGNNEVVGPFGAGTVFHQYSMNRNLIKAGLFFRKFYLGQLLSKLFDGSKKHKISGKWRGMEMFLGNLVASDDPQLDQVYSNFDKNLKEICSVLRDEASTIILSTVAVNLKDSPPFASIIADSIIMRQTTVSSFEQGTDALKQGEWQSAQSFFLKALAKDSTNANIHYRLGQCALSLKDFEKATFYFNQALAFDALRFRADANINTIIANVATHLNVPIADVEQFIRNKSDNGLPGSHYFYEHVHFNFDGNYVLASAMFNLIHDCDYFQIKTDHCLSREACQTALAYTIFNQIDILEQIHHRLSQPPFTNQLDHKDRIAALAQKINDFKESIHSANIEEAMRIYQKALHNRPDDVDLMHNFASLLMNLGMNREAEKAYRDVLANIPHYSQAWNNLGLVSYRLHKYTKAIDAYQNALKYGDPSAEVYNNLGMVYSQKKQFDQANHYYDLALEINPEFVQALMNKGAVCYQKNQMKQAIRLYRKAVQINDTDAYGHYNLAYALLNDKQYKEAEIHFQKALNLKPDFAAAQRQLEKLKNLSR